MHLAQVNIGRVRAPVEAPLMSGFVSALDEINALADCAPGFVWRLQTAEGNATAYHPYGHDDRILLNMSVWESIDALRAYTYETEHAGFLRRRREWFEKFDGIYLALWWIPVGHIPTIEEAKERLAHLEAHGPTPFAFTFKVSFPSDNP